jgi:hypothetical protein
MRVFISYRALKPDTELALKFHSALVRAGHEPFMAKETIDWGDEWAVDVDEALSECECYLLLLSNEAAKSDAVLEEVETIHHRFQTTTSPKPRVFVLEVLLSERPGFDLRLLIRRFQRRTWNSYADTAGAISELLEQLSRTEPAVVSADPNRLWSALPYGMPSPTAELPGGQLGADSDLYQSREGLDAVASAWILRPHALLRIKGPRQVGKTSLMARIQAYAAKEGNQCASLSMQLTGAETRSSTEALLIWLCKSLKTALALPVDPPRTFSFGGPVLACGEFVEHAILRTVNRPVVIALDELESLVDTPKVANDFNDMLRGWNQRAANEPIWNNLRLVVSYSTEGSLVTGSQTTSPLENVGRAITLRDFNQDELRQLAGQFSRHGREAEREIVSYVFEEANGHPYLSSVALYEWCVNGTLPETSLSWSLPGPVREHMVRLLKKVRRAPEIARALWQVCGADTAVLLPDLEEMFTLEGAGLVRVLPDGAAVPRCRLYRNFFGRNLTRRVVKSNEQSP